MSCRWGESGLSRSNQGRPSARSTFSRCIGLPNWCGRHVETVVYGGAIRQSGSDSQAIPLADLPGTLKMLDVNMEIAAFVEENKGPAADDADLKALDRAFSRHIRPVSGWAGSQRSDRWRVPFFAATAKPRSCVWTTRKAARVACWKPGTGRRRKPNTSSRRASG